ncbi:acetylglutamate kinase [Fusibacter ferrireducens]|uniref:Acetylglutamate kinase n=1 Tax=Fusibacter ferrireducens TaxID=2785058 RepID=A0ABR9ZXZ3_9FIRM|nr:acetylglutamate kinase [Fusibacter ferrireducens]MBF4695241.1 acetylglutamate kinase [Fusibacter ferrireducens]
MEKYIDKARILIEALPYIHEFKGKIFVIKYGGSAMKDPLLRQNVIMDICLLASVGILPVIVHGGGNDITKLLDEVGQETTFHNGIRLTNDDNVDYVEMMLSGKINKQIVADINFSHGLAVGISGRDGCLVKAELFDAENASMDRVGKICSIETALIETLLNAGYIPVISPIGTDSNGKALNINADEVAGEIANALCAEKLIYLTDVDGVFENDKLISQINAKEASDLIEKGVISGGMIPKVSYCIQSNVDNVHILNGTLEHSILLEIFTQEGIGTKVIKA